jgi:hypothetical protein
MGKYKFGKDQHGAEVVTTDLPGEHQPVGIWNLHVLIVPEGNGWFAQAFEIDYGVQGNSPEEVKKRFEQGLAATIQHNLDIFGSINNMLHPNQDWYALKAQIKGAEYDYSCVEVFRVLPKLADKFSLMYYETVRQVQVATA